MVQPGEILHIIPLGMVNAVILPAITVVDVVPVPALVGIGQHGAVVLPAAQINVAVVGCILARVRAIQIGHNRAPFGYISLGLSFHLII